MRSSTVLLITLIALGLSACTRQETDTAAHKAGKTAHEVVIETEKAAKKAGRELKKAAQEARDGWKEGQREERSKDK